VSVLSQKQRERAIKIAARELVALLGGQEAAADIIGKSQSHVQRCCSVHDPDNFFNARDIGVMEDHAGEPLITATFAKQAGGVFLALPDPALCDDDTLPLMVVKIADELGDVSHALRDAVRDNRIDQAELAVIERQFDELVAAAVDGRAMVQVLNHGAPVAVPIKRKDAAA